MKCIFTFIERNENYILFEMVSTKNFIMYCVWVLFLLLYFELLKKKLLSPYGVYRSSKWCWYGGYLLSVKCSHMTRGVYSVLILNKVKYKLRIYKTIIYISLIFCVKQIHILHLKTIKKMVSILTYTLN